MSDAVRRAKLGDQVGTVQKKEGGRTARSSLAIPSAERGLMKKKVMRALRTARPACKSTDEEIYEVSTSSHHDLRETTGRTTADPERPSVPLRAVRSAECYRR